MLVFVKASVLMIGLEHRNEALHRLPIRVISVQSGTEAARSLKSENVNSVISSWNLEDVDANRFFRHLKLLKPDLPTIVIVKSGNTVQEIAARSLGVSAVLYDQTPDEVFEQTVANVLGLTECLLAEEMSLSKS